MNIFNMEINIDTLLAITGMVFGVTSQLLVWIYMIASARGVELPVYGDFRANVNISYLFSMLVLSFLFLTGASIESVLCRNLVAALLAGWVLVLFAALVILAVRRVSRPSMRSALGATLFKVAITALILWVIY